MKTLPLSVLYSDGPMARSYLACLRRAGMRPRKILRLIFNCNQATGKKKRLWLPGGMGRAYKAWSQDVSMNHWPRQIRRTLPGLYETVTERVSESLSLGEGFFDEILGKQRLEDYADEVVQLAIDSLADPRLVDHVTKDSQKTLLFTGGGILPKAVLEIDGLRVLHIHPGILPNIRGADGLLWSVLLRGRPGASCFYMAHHYCPVNYRTNPIG